MRSSFASTLLVVVALAFPATALARTGSDYPYPAERVWNAALRLIRVDLQCPLGDKDADVGYFMFEYHDGARKYSGSLEIVRARIEGRDGVHVVVQIPNLPTYVERMILDRLGRKLVEDFGEPPPAQRPPQQAPRDRNHDEDHDRDRNGHHDHDGDSNHDDDENHDNDPRAPSQNRPNRSAPPNLGDPTEPTAPSEPLD